MVFQSPTSLLGLFGKPAIPVTARTVAHFPLELQNIRIRAANASGWWSKVMTLMVRRPGASVDTEVVRFVYDANRNRLTGPTGWIDIGAYEHAYFRMKIDPRSRAFIRGFPTELRTDQPRYSHRMYIDSKRVPRNTRVDIMKTVECGRSIRHQWEDGGGDAPDFGYVIDAQCGVASSAKARIVE